MSDYDSEDYISSEDEDYVPSGGEYSEDDVNELVDEEDLEGVEKAPQTGSGKKNKAKGLQPRKRKKGGLALELQSTGDVQGPPDAEAPDFSQEKVAKTEHDQKKKADDLWASFLSDVGQKPKASVPASTPKEHTQATPKADETPHSDKPKDAAKVTITKVFDFAGEEVRVTKEVAATSKEAKSYLKQQDEGAPQGSPLPVASPAAPPGLKRPGGMNSVLGSLIGKKQKMSTLEKSKMDWESFKEKEGIGDELAIHNRGKEGYIERKAFLERVDHRQFELERDVRLKNMKK
ncbi:craniofacial development protein 1-like [Lissotriton helveticus]